MAEEFTNEEKKVVCPRCGFDISKEYTPLSEELIKSYFKSALAQVPFSKTYSLFGGIIDVTFEEATGKLLQAQEGALRLKNANGTMGVADAMDFALLPSLVSISYKHPETGLKQEVYSATAAEREEYLKKGELPDVLTSMPIVKLQAVRNTFATFAKLCADLVVASQDESFWEGVGRN